MGISICGEYKKTLIEYMKNGYTEFRIPGILAYQGVVLMSCEGRSAHGSDWGDVDILVYRMEVDGEPQLMLTIGESGFLPDGTKRTYHNAVWIPDGERIHLLYHKSYLQTFIITSEDSGMTWTEPREITEVYRHFPYEWNISASGPGHGIRMKNGRLVVPVWLANGRELADGTIEHWPSVAGCIYSDDHGITWQAGGLVDQECILDANETTVAELPDGQLLFNHRHRETNDLRAQSRSGDGGETMGAPYMVEDLQSPWCCAGLVSISDGLLFVHCNSRNKDGRINITVDFSEKGDHWETIWNVDSVGGYSDIAVEDNNVYVLYEHTCFLPEQSKCAITELILQKGTIQR